MSNKEYLTVGELSKIMNVTVRTLQYYDKEGILCPSKMSEGGRRLYSSKDIVKLNQILSFKYLGFSLDDIKEKIFKFDTTEEVVEALSQQESIMEMQINNLSKALKSLKTFKDEVIQMQDVNFDKYATIIELIRLNSKEYWVIKAMDDTVIDHLRETLQNDFKKGEELFLFYQKVLEETLEMKKMNISNTSDQAIELAGRWWAMIMDFTNGDMSLLPKLMEFNDNKQIWNPEIAEKQEQIDEFIGKALEAYFAKQGASFPLEDKENE